MGKRKKLHDVEKVERTDMDMERITALRKIRDEIDALIDEEYARAGISIYPVYPGSPVPYIYPTPPYHPSPTYIEPPFITWCGDMPVAVKSTIDHTNYSPLPEFSDAVKNCIGIP